MIMIMKEISLQEVRMKIDKRKGKRWKIAEHQKEIESQLTSVGLPL